MRQPPGESDMAVSDALLPSFSTFASGPAGREKTLRQAGAPNNVRNLTTVTGTAVDGNSPAQMN
uniref:Isoform 5 of Krueppel-like factor 4 n=1 Tax=Homo sapiens TaxID=9606 RepID=O43474-6|nr:Kruppel-like factor 4 (gut) [Homo sapiens]